VPSLKINGEVSSPESHRTIGDGYKWMGQMGSIGKWEGRRDSHAKSTVIPNGVPSSSLRAYLLPIDTLDESTREETPDLRSFDAVVIRGDGVSITVSHQKRSERTDFLHERLKAVVRRYWNDEDFDGCD